MAADPDSHDHEPPPGAAGQRFEATVHPGAAGLALSAVADLDLDRLPDPDGGMRVLVNAAELASLVRQGYEVRLQRAMPVQALAPELVMSDEAADSWTRDRLADIPREGS